MICCIYNWGVVKAPCICIRIPTIVGLEDTPQVGSLLPVGPGPISDGYTPYTKTCINNLRISIRVILSLFWCFLYGWERMSKELPNDTSADSYLVPGNRTIYVIRENIKKIAKIVKSIYICILLCNVSIYCRRVMLFGYVF